MRGPKAMGIYNLVFNKTTSPIKVGWLKSNAFIVVTGRSNFLLVYTFRASYIQNSQVGEIILGSFDIPNGRGFQETGLSKLGIKRR